MTRARPMSTTQLLLVLCGVVPAAASPRPSMTKKPVAKSLPVRGQAPGQLEAIEDDKWKRLEALAQAIRSLGANPLTKAHAERLAERLGINKLHVIALGAHFRSVIVSYFGPHLSG